MFRRNPGKEVEKNEVESPDVDDAAAEETEVEETQHPVSLPLVYKLETPVKFASGRVITELVCKDYPRTKTLKRIMNTATDAEAFEIMLDDLFDCEPLVQDMLRMSDSKAAVELLQETFPNDLGEG